SLPLSKDLKKEEVERIERIVDKLFDISEIFSGSRHSHYDHYLKVAWEYDEIFTFKDGGDSILSTEAWKSHPIEQQTLLKNYHLERFVFLLDYFPSASYLESLPHIMGEWPAIKIDLFHFLDYWQSRLHEVPALRHLADFLNTKSERIPAGNYPDELRT